jgi:hypothetical protein
MFVPTSEVGYTSATAGRGDYEVHKGHVTAFGGDKNRVDGYSAVMDTFCLTVSQYLVRNSPPLQESDVNYLVLVSILSQNNPV